MLWFCAGPTKDQRWESVYKWRKTTNVLTFSTRFLLTASPPLLVSSLTTMHCSSGSLMEGPKGSERGTISYCREGLTSFRNPCSLCTRRPYGSISSFKTLSAKRDATVFYIFSKNVYYSRLPVSLGLDVISWWTDKSNVYKSILDNHKPTQKILHLKQFLRVSTHFLTIPDRTHRWESVYWPANKKYSAGSCGHREGDRKCRPPPRRWRTVTAFPFFLGHCLPHPWPLLVQNKEGQKRDLACRRNSDRRTALSTGRPARTPRGLGWGSLSTQLLVSGRAPAGWEKVRWMPPTLRIVHGC